MWAKGAIDHVAGTYDWMRDVAPDRDGNWSFKPDRFETRKWWAQALVRAFAPDAQPIVKLLDGDAKSREFVFKSEDRAPWKLVSVSIKQPSFTHGFGHGH